MRVPDNTITQTVTIAAGASLSGASTKYSGFKVVGVVTASTWDAAKMSFSVSNDGTNFFPLWTDTGEYQVATVTGAAAIAVEPKNFIGWDYLKVQSGITGATTNQVDATIVTLVMMPI